MASPGQPDLFRYPGGRRVDGDCRQDEGRPRCRPDAYQVSSPDGKVELRISGASDGEPLLEHEQEFAGHDPATPLFVTWKPLPKGTRWGGSTSRSPTPVARSRASRTPLVDQHPHEEVNFATDSASIDRAEVPKLQASLGKIADALAKHKNLSPPPKLYIAGHTDTVGLRPQPRPVPPARPVHRRLVSQERFAHPHLLRRLR